jgi:hypothetical protein
LIFVKLAYRKGRFMIMTGLWIPVMFEDGNGNIPKGGQIFTDSYSEDTYTHCKVSTVNK